MTRAKQQAAAEHEIRFLLRQISGQPLPDELPMPPHVLDLVDAATAQKLYERLRAELEAVD